MPLKNRYRFLIVVLAVLLLFTSAAAAASISNTSITNVNVYASSNQFDIAPAGYYDNTVTTSGITHVSGRYIALLTGASLTNDTSQGEPKQIGDTVTFTVNGQQGAAVYLDGNNNLQLGYYFSTYGEGGGQVGNNPLTASYSTGGTKNASMILWGWDGTAGSTIQAGTLTSTAYIVGGAPQITSFTTTPPTGSYAAVNDPVTLTATVDTQDAVTYSWYYTTDPNPSASSVWTKIGADTVAGTTTYNLETAADYTFKVIVTKGADSTDSFDTGLTSLVHAVGAPTISQEAAIGTSGYVTDISYDTVSGPLNQTAYLSVAAAAAGGTVAYQWFENGTAISGATTAEYTAVNADSDNTVHEYYCRISSVEVPAVYTDSRTVYLNTYKEPTLTISPTAGGITDTVTLTATDTGFTGIQWKVSKDGGAYTNLGTANPYSYVPGAAGTYTYQAVLTYAGGYTQTVTAQQTVTIYAEPALTVSPATGGITDTVTLTATDTRYQSIQWKVSKDGGAYTNLGTANPYSYVPGAAGTYTYQAVLTYPGGYTQTVTAQQTVTIYAEPTLTVSPVSGNIGDTVTLTATDTGYTSIQWKVSTDGTTYTNLGTTNPYSYSPTAAGTYHYQAVFSYPGGYAQTVTATQTVTIYTVPEITLTPSIGDIGDVVTLFAAPAGYTSIQWKVSTDGTTYTDLGTTNPYSYSPTAAGTYHYQAVFSYPGGYTQTVTVADTVTIYAEPILTPSPTVGTVGNIVTLTATNTGYTSIQWKVSTDGTTYTDLGTTNPYSYSPTAAGTYHYQAVFNYPGSHTQIVTAADTVTIYAEPVLTVTPTVGFLDSVVTLTATDTGYISIQWKVSKDGGAYTNLGTANPYSYTPGAAGTYRYQAVFSYPGGYTQTINSDTTVSIYTLPTATIYPTRGGLSDTYVLNTQDLGSDYQWYYSADNGTTWNPISGATTPTYNLIPQEAGLAAGQYIFRAAYTYQSTPVVTTNTTTTYVYAEPVLTVTPTVGGTTDTVTLTATDTGYTSIQWKVSKDGGAYTNLGTANPYSYTPGVAGTYRYQGVFTYPGGYTQTVTAAQTVTIYAEPQLTISPTAGDVGDTVTLTATDTGYTSIQWKVSTDGTTYTNLSTENPYSYTPAAGTYHYQAVLTYPGGYTQTVTAAQTVTIYPMPTLTVSPVVGDVGDTVTLTATNTGYTSIQWKVSPDGAVYTNLSIENPYSYIPAAGMYHYQAVLTYPGGHTQTVTATDTVTIYAKPQLTISPTVGDAGDTVTLTATSTGYQAVQWKVSTDGTTYTDLGIGTPYSYTPAAGTYHYQAVFTYTGGHVQTVTATDTVTIYAKPTLTVTPQYGGTTDTVTLTATDTGYTSIQWKVSKDSGAYTNLGTANPYSYVPGAAGTYSYQAVLTYTGGHTQTVTAADVVIIYQTPALTVSPAAGGLTQAVTLTATNTGYQSVQWKVSKDWGAYTNLGTANPYSYVPGVEGVYTYQGVFTYPGGYTQTVTAAQTVTIYAEPQLTVSPTVGGAGDQITLSASNTGYTSIQWESSADNGTTWNPLGNTNPYSYFPQAGTYNYRAVFSYPGGYTQTVTAQQTVTIYAEPQLTVSPITGGLVTPVTLTATDTGYTSIQWKVSKNGGIYTNIGTTNPYSYTPGAAGIYSYQGVFTYPGGYTQTVYVQASVTIYADPIPVTPGGPTVPIAVPYQITLTAAVQNPETVTAYYWQLQTGGGTWTRTADGPNYQPTITTPGQYVYRFVAVGHGGQEIPSPTITVDAGYAPTADITAPIGNEPYNLGDTVNIAATIGGTDATYTFDFGDHVESYTGKTGTVDELTKAIAATVVYQAAREYKTIKLTVSNRYGPNATDTVQILYGQPRRPIATQTPIPLDTSGMQELIEKAMPQSAENQMPDITGMIKGVTKPFTDVIGEWFWLLLFAVPFLIMWIRQKNLLIPSIIGVLFAAWLLVFLPGAAMKAAIGILILAVAGGIYGLYVRTHRQ